MWTIKGKLNEESPTIAVCVEAGIAWEAITKASEWGMQEIYSLGLNKVMEVYRSEDAPNFDDNWWELTLSNQPVDGKGKGKDYKILFQATDMNMAVTLAQDIAGQGYDLASTSIKKTNFQACL